MLFQMQNILKCERTHPLTDLIMQPAVAGTRSSDEETGCTAPCSSKLPITEPISGSLPTQPSPRRVTLRLTHNIHARLYEK